MAPRSLFGRSDTIAPGVGRARSADIADQRNRGSRGRHVQRTRFKDKQKRAEGNRDPGKEECLRTHDLGRAIAGRLLVSGVLVASLGTLLAPAVMANPLIPDQQSLVDITAGWSAMYLAPMGQELVPQLRSLDAVELILANTDASSPFTADVEVNIREANMGGPIRGTSLPVNLPFGSFGVAHFDFVPSVRLKPGRTYVIEIVVLPGGGNVGVSGGWSNSYAAGRAIIQGTPVPPTDTSDLWFREGTHRRTGR